jgi:hypothetical protein
MRLPGKENNDFFVGGTLFWDSFLVFHPFHYNNVIFFSSKALILKTDNLQLVFENNKNFKCFFISQSAEKVEILMTHPMSPPMLGDEVKTFVHYTFSISKIISNRKQKIWYFNYRAYVCSCAAKPWRMY